MTQPAQHNTVELELFKFDSCPYCQKVLAAVDKLDLKLKLSDTHQDEAARQRLISVGGKEQVPCLFVDGKPMYESADIIAFLEREFSSL